MAVDYLKRMITTPKVVQDLEYVRRETNVRFKTFGLFFLKLLFLSAKDQRFIAEKLKYAARHARDRDGVEIISFSRPKIKLKDNEQQFRFIIEHSFICTLCGCHSRGGSNCAGGFFQSNCEVCQDKAYEYQSDSVANQLYD